MTDPNPPTAGARRVAYLPHPGHDPARHETVSLARLAERIAGVLGLPFAGRHAAGMDHVYLVPARSLTADEADALGVRSARDLFGGVVPHAFVATKVVSHPAVSTTSRVPDGWSWALSERMQDAVLPGVAVFDRDAVRAGFERLRPLGAARLKLARGIGGHGQFLVHDADELEDALAQLPEDELQAHGATLEQHLDDSTTFSVGEVELGDLRIAYCGTQRETPDREGGSAYGGSRLRVVRGGLEALEAHTDDPDERRAVAQARQFDRAIEDAFPGFFASRRNYDVIQGTDIAGQRRSGVLEQSWRIGGATPAELAAFEAFRDDPGLTTVVADCEEKHALVDAPDDAVVHYHEADPVIGPVTKYSRIEQRGHAH